MGYRRRLEEKDLPENLPAHDSQFLSEALERYSFSSHRFHSPKSSRQAIQHILKVILILRNYREWQKELRKERQSFFLALVRFARVEVAISTILLLIVVRDKYSALMECKRMLSTGNIYSYIPRLKGVRSLFRLPGAVSCLRLCKYGFLKGFIKYNNLSFYKTSIDSKIQVGYIMEQLK